MAGVLTNITPLLPSSSRRQLKAANPKCFIEPNSGKAACEAAAAQAGP